MRLVKLHFKEIVEGVGTKGDAFFVNPLKIDTVDCFMSNTLIYIGKEIKVWEPLDSVVKLINQELDSIG